MSPRPSKNSQIADTDIQNHNNKVIKKQKADIIPEGYIIPVTIDYPLTFIELVKWQAQGKNLRSPRTLKSFARKHGISANTLTTYRETSEFNQCLRAEVRRILGNSTPELAQAMLKQALRGNVRAQETILKWIGEMQEATTGTTIEKAYVFQWQDNGSTKPITIDEE